MIQYCKGCEGDYEAIIAFANTIFTQAYEAHDFTNLVPKLYRNHKDMARDHYLVKEEGSIRAMLCAYPVQLNVNGELIETRGIGTVAVHLEDRKKGYMQKLMKWAIEEMQQEGIVMGMLGGQRQRYEYFGFTPSGMEIQFLVTKKNIEHMYRHIDGSSMKVIRVEETDIELIGELYQLHQKQKVHAVRRQEMFYDICATWQAKLYACMCNEKLVGYMILKEDSIYEWLVTDGATIPEFLTSVFQQLQLEQVHMNLPIYEENKIEPLKGLCENYTIACNKSILVLDYAKLIKKLIRLKNTYTSLKEGALRLEIQGYGKIIIEVKEKTISVNKYEGEVDFSLKHLEAMELLFSPLGMLTTKNMDNEYVTSWFPLPLYVPIVDSI